MRRIGAAPAVLLAAALLAAAALGTASGALLAIDLGAEYMKLSIVKPGRIPISIVNNEMSKRKTPALVAFVDGDRLVGEEAASIATRFPDRVYGRVVDLLGRSADDPRLAAMLKGSYRPYTLVAAANRTSPATLAVETEQGDAYSAEEVVASLLEYAKNLAEVAADGAPITDAVLAVPASFTPQQRQSLLDAAKLAGLNVLGLIHNHAAAALQYGIERDFTNKTETVVLYDVGAASLQAALVTYSAYTNAKGVSISQFDVRDVIWREDIGGEQLELALMEHFADEFNSQLGKGQDVRSAPRAMAKLRKQVVRTKQILSANSEAPLSVEELWQDKDFRTTISRTKFEELAGDFWDRAVAPLRLLLERNNLTAADLSAVELLGGTSRVPRLKQALSEVLGGRALDMHLDADEAVVLGAGLFAANLSTIFRLRQFGMADKTPYSVAIQLEGEAAPKTLVPGLKKMPTKRGVHLHNLTADSLAFTLDFDNGAGAFPCCRRTFRLGEFNVSGIHSVIAKYNESGKVSIHTRVDHSGIFSVDRADASVEVMEVVPPPPPPPATNDTANATDASGSAGNAADTAAADDAAGDAKADTGADADAKAKDDGTAGAAGASAPAAEPAEPAEPPKMRKRTLKIPLNVTGGFAAPGMNQTEMSASRKVLRRLRVHDEAKRETAKTRNDLEAYIIATRDKIESSKSVAAVTTEEQREQFLAQLTEQEDWLYGDGDTAETAEYRSHLRTLRDVGDKIFDRVAEAEAQPQAVKQAEQFVELTRKSANSWPGIKPWLEAGDIAVLVEKVDNFSSWLKGKQEEQAKLAAHEEPAFRAEEVTSSLAKLQKAYNRLNNKKQPKPPPLPPPPTPPTVESNDTASDNSTDAGAGKEGKEGEQQQDTKEAKTEGEEPAKDESDDGDDMPAHDELR